MDLAILLALILINGIFAMSELALVTARKSRLQRLAENGDKRAATAIKLGEDSTQFLSTIQIGITAIGVLSGIFGEAALAGPLAEFLVSMGMDAENSSFAATTVVVISITFLSIVLGELIPKRLAQFQPEKIALLISYPIAVLSVLSKPFVFLLSVSTNSILRLLGKSNDSSEELTEEDIQAMLVEGSQAGIIEQQEHAIIRNAFRLDDRPVESLMTPRNEIMALDIDKSITENLGFIIESSFSHFPVYQESIDNILGYVSAKSLLKCPHNTPCFNIRDNIIPPVYVLESLSCMKLLEQFRASRSNMVFVVNEFGDLQGIVTLQDIFKALTGDFKAHDNDDEWASIQEDGDVLLDGLIPIPELKDVLNLKTVPQEEKGHYHTLNGMFMALEAKIPQVGDTTEWENWKFIVLNLDGHRIDKIRAHKVEQKEE